MNENCLTQARKLTDRRQMTSLKTLAIWILKSLNITLALCFPNNALLPISVFNYILGIQLQLDPELKQIKLGASNN